MTKTLQKKFVVTAMTAISVLILVMLGTINIVNFVVNEKQMERTLYKLSENDAPFLRGNPIPNQEERPFAQERPPRLSMIPDGEDNTMFAQYFLVKFDPAGNVVYVDCDRVDYVTEDEAKNQAAAVYDSGKREGQKGYFRYVLLDSRDGQGKTVVFLNISDQILSMFRVLVISVVIGILGWGLMLLLVMLLSRRAIFPIAQNIEKQRQFVTNAGHEIKTPLAIILANVDAMELHTGENKWSKNIRTQTTRLNGLMQNLLLLSKMDEGVAGFIADDVLVSELLQESVEAYVEPAGLKKIQIHTDIGTGISLRVNRENLMQLISIMLDNAVKYTNEEGRIQVALKKDGRHVKMLFSNTCKELPPNSPEQLFERFYRADSARTQQSGGYGIGLSVAKAIVESFHGSIRAEYRENNEIIFMIEIG